MVDFKLIKKLIETVKEEGITGLSVEEGGVKYEVRCDKSGNIISSPPAAVPAAPSVSQSKPTEDPEDKDTIAITSPMVGTFYRSPSPDSAPFVEVGDQTSPGKVVCIIEAMKLFNEIESEVGGKIVKILVENGQPVEYGQKLMLIKKA